MQQPGTKYTKVGDSDIAYQVVGDGPIDVLYVTGFMGNIELQWENALARRPIEDVAAWARVIVFDRRGTGASYRFPPDALPTWENWAEDVSAVLEAAGSERTGIFTDHDGGPMAMLYAATHPERLSALVLWNTTARYLAAPDYPIGLPPEQAEAMAAMVEQGWGTRELVAFGSPSRAQDPEFLGWASRAMRLSVAPHAAAAQVRYMFGLDARSVLPLIRVPTLVMHRSDFALIPVTHGQFLAEHIPGARFIEIPGADMLSWSDPETADAIFDHVEEFLTGVRHALRPDRVLLTVLLTDIVDSTKRAAELGDRRWKDLLESHDTLARRTVEQFRGHLVKTTGDGVLAGFDGPGRAIRCAQALQDALRSLGVEIRAGLHTGEVELRSDGDIGGIAVHIAARVAALAAPGEVLVSRTVVDLVAGSGIELAERGTHQLKGVPGEWRLSAARRAR